MKLTKSHLILTLLVSILISACSSDKDANVHPNDRNMPSSSEANIINLEEELSRPATNENDQLVADLKNREKVATFGNNTGGDNVLFGRIKDVVIDSSGRIYVLDSKKVQIQVFDREGKHLASVGSKGEGPGEFKRPNSIALYKNSLMVDDGTNLEVFDISTEGFPHKETISLDKMAHSICTIGDTLFLHNIGLYEQAKEAKNKQHVPIIHAYSLPSFDHQFSFGKSYKSSHPDVLDRLSRGMINCNPTSQTVSFVFEKFPVIRGYSSENGQRLWQTFIKGPKIVEVVYNEERRSLSFTFPSEKHRDAIYSPVSYQKDQEILQIKRHYTQKDAPDPKVFTFLLDRSTGKNRAIFEDLPNISAVSDERVVAVSDDKTSFTLYKLP